MHWRRILGADWLTYTACSHSQSSFVLCSCTLDLRIPWIDFPNFLTYSQELRPRGAQCSFVSINIGARRRHHGSFFFASSYTFGNDLEDFHHSLGRHRGEILCLSNLSDRFTRSLAFGKGFDGGSLMRHPLWAKRSVASRCGGLIGAPERAWYKILSQRPTQSGGGRLGSVWRGLEGL